MSDKDESFETIVSARSSRPRDQEPTFFTTTTAEQTGFNRPDREGFVMRNDKRARVKHPQAGHVGEYDDFTRLRGEGTRWITVVNSQGNVVYYVLTNGAGDMNPNSEYAVDRKQKARFYGWYPIGQCPVALLAAGEMHKGHFTPIGHKKKSVKDGKDVEETTWETSPLLTAQPCHPGSYSIGNPCPHALAERAARMKKHEVREDEVRDAHANKLVASQKAQTDALVASQQAQTEAIVKGQREIVEAMLGEPAKGKK